MGIGGTGVNIIQVLIESGKLSELISTEDFSIACLAIDVADGDLKNLKDSYGSVMENMRSKGISLEKMWVKPVNIKFNTPDALFEFMEKYSKYLLLESVAVSNYKPWIQSSMSIPPLAGGVGRQRALSKAIYALNYYHYVEINNVMNVFKDRALTSAYQPIVFVVFGLGGGTGGGMIFDFAHHLRSKFGSAIPIVGLAILPSSADDLLARGPSPYAALVESELLFNRELNDKVTSIFGDAYRNPFTAMFFLPLDPVYNNSNSLLLAKKELDEAVVDILRLFMGFDLADLLSRVGTNNDFGPNWVHTLAYLRVRYPLDDYVRFFKEYLQLNTAIGEFLRLKTEALSGVNAVLDDKYSELVELFRRHLISINAYRSDTFEDEVRDVIHRGGKYDVELRKQVKGIEGFASFYITRWSKAFKAMEYPPETSEHAVLDMSSRLMDQLVHLSKSWEDFYSRLGNSREEIEGNLSASKYLTSSEMQQVRSFLQLVDLAGLSIKTLQTYLGAKALANEVAIRYAKGKSSEVKRVVNLGDVELMPLFKLLGSLLVDPASEFKMLDQQLPSVRVLKNNLDKRLKDKGGEIESQQRKIAQKEQDRAKLQREISKIRIDISGRRKLLQRDLNELENDIVGFKGSLAQLREEDEKLRRELERLVHVERSLESASQYRKLLTSIVSKSNELNDMMSSITKTASYYEKVVELSEDEHVKLMGRLVKEEEASLRGEGVLKEIVNRDRFREVVRSYMRIFSVPNYAGLNDRYRSDLIWATVGIPQALWDQELQVALVSTLNGFSSVEASKSITIRQIPQVDPWTITFLVVFAKATSDQLEKFSSMRNDAEGVRKSEKVMFRSFLLEHGLQDIGSLTSEIGGKLS